MIALFVDFGPQRFQILTQFRRRKSHLAILTYLQAQNKRVLQVTKSPQHDNIH